MSEVTEATPEAEPPAPATLDGPPLNATPPTNPYVTVAQFRLDFPAFADTTKFPDITVQRFLDIAGIMVPVPVWGRMASFGMELVTAHFLTLQQYFIARMSGATGAVPGMASGVMTSKSVSKVSAGYDTKLTGIEGGGPWNYTIYGQQYLWWANLAGTGGYETLGAVNPMSDMAGIVNTWARGVQIGWLGGGF